MSQTVAPEDLLRRLVTIGESLVHDRRIQISDAAIRTLREEVAFVRYTPRETAPIIDYEAANLVECFAAIAYARSEKNEVRESRAITYANSLLHFMRSDLSGLERRAMQ